MRPSLFEDGRRGSVTELVEPAIALTSYGLCTENGLVPRLRAQARNLLHEQRILPVMSVSTTIVFVRHRPGVPGEGITTILAAGVGVGDAL